jgi:hypothetical protein
MGFDTQNMESSISKIETRYYILTCAFYKQHFPLINCLAGGGNTNPTPNHLGGGGGFLLYTKLSSHPLQLKSTKFDCFVNLLDPKVTVGAPIAKPKH